MNKYDVICIGGGHASWPIAVALQKSGKRALLITNDKLGGTCTSYGCDPKILLDAPFEIMAEARRYEHIGLRGDLSIDWQALQAYNRKVIGPLPDGLKSMVEAAGVDILFGDALLTGPHSVSLDGAEYHADNIVIATGRRAASLDVPGGEHVRDSSDFLYAEDLPQRIVFIGAGIISLEFASMAIKMGREVTILHNDMPILPQYHDQYVRKIVEHLQGEGVVFHLDQTVTEIAQLDDAYLVKTGSGLEVAADYIVGASGRTANIEKLGLDEIGVAYTAKGIPTDDCLQTNIPGIFASGDVRDTMVPRLTPTAFFEAAYIARRLLGEDAPIDYPIVPNLVFTIPRIAQVGVSQREAAMSDDFQIEHVEYGKRFLFQTRNEEDAEISFVLDRKGYLVGADIYGDFAAELINFLTFIISQRLSALDLEKMVFAFPAQSFAAVKLILEGLLTRD